MENDLIEVEESINILYHKLDILEGLPRDNSLKIEEVLDELAKLKSVRDSIILEIEASRFI